MGGALGFYGYATGTDTPVVVLALSIASVTYGALLGTYILAGRWPRARGTDVILATIVTISVMLVVVFANRLGLTTLGRLAWPWYVPLGTLITLMVGAGLSLLHPAEDSSA